MQQQKEGQDPQEKKPYQLDFYAYEQQGMDVYYNQPDSFTEEQLKPIKELDGLGGIVLIPGLLGGYFRAKVEDYEGSAQRKSALALAINGGLMVTLQWVEDQTFGPSWRAVCFGDARALAKCDFS
jgi:hypothetical protein